MNNIIIDDMIKNSALKKKEPKNIAIENCFQITILEMQKANLCFERLKEYGVKTYKDFRLLFGLNMIGYDEDELYMFYNRYEFDLELSNKLEMLVNSFTAAIDFEDRRPDNIYKL